MKKRGKALGVILLFLVIIVLLVGVGIYFLVGSSPVIKKDIGSFKYKLSKTEDRLGCNFVKGEGGCTLVHAEYSSSEGHVSGAYPSVELHENRFPISQATNEVKSFLDGWNEENPVTLKSWKGRQYYSTIDINEYIFAWATDKEVVFISSISKDETVITAEDLSEIFDAYMKKYPSKL